MVVEPDLEQLTDDPAMIPATIPARSTLGPDDCGFGSMKSQLSSFQWCVCEFPPGVASNRRLALNQVRERANHRRPRQSDGV
jgi:hypothetical protein